MFSFYVSIKDLDQINERKKKKKIGRFISSPLESRSKVKNTKIQLVNTQDPKSKKWIFYYRDLIIVEIPESSKF